MESLAVGKMLSEGVLKDHPSDPYQWNNCQSDLTYLVNNESLSVYADDHQLYVKGQTVDCVEKQLNEGGHIISRAVV